jgi:hypothetical protein
MAFWLVDRLHVVHATAIPLLPDLAHPGAARCSSRLGIGQAAPWAAISSARMEAAFQSHLLQATRITSRGSSASR